MELKDKLKKLRIKHEMSQETLAQELHVSRQAITKWENGNGIPEISNLIAISELFHISVDTLIKDDMELETKQESKLFEFTCAGSSIGFALGLMFSQVSILSGLIGGAIIGYVLRYIMIINTPLTNSNKKDMQKVITYLKENETEISLIILGASIGAILGLIAWNKGWL